MKIAVVGCGGIASTHLRVIKRLMPDGKICLCDPLVSRAQELAASQDQRVAVFSDADDLLSSEKPDVVHITSPPDTHFALAQKSLQAGCHVFLEKPATDSVAEFCQLVDLSRSRGRVLCVDYSTLGMPVVRKAKGIVDSGALGNVVSVHCDYACSWPSNTMPYGNPSHWSYSLPGGIMQNWVDHPASLILDFLDSVERQEVMLSRRCRLPMDCPDLLHVAISSGSQIGSFTLSLGHGRTEIQAHVLLEGGTIFIDLRRMLLVVSRSKGSQNHIKRMLSGLVEGHALIRGTLANCYEIARGRLQREPGIAHMIEAFYSLIAGGRTLLYPQKALAVVRLNEAVIEKFRGE